MNHPFDTIELAAFAIGGLSEKKRTAIENHLASCADCSQKVAALKQEQQVFLQKMPTAPNINTHAPVKNTTPFPSMTTMKPFAIAALLLFTTILVTQSPTLKTTLMPRTVAIKGSESIAIVVQSTDGTIESRADHIYHPAERIQFLYSAVSNLYLVIASMDSSGTVSIYYDHGEKPIEPGSAIPLPASIRLDNYLGSELICAAFTSKPVPASELSTLMEVAFARNGNSLGGLSIEPPDGYILRTFAIVKKAGKK